MNVLGQQIPGQINPVGTPLPPVKTIVVKKKEKSKCAACEAGASPYATAGLTKGKK